MHKNVPQPVEAACRGRELHLGGRLAGSEVYVLGNRPFVNSRVEKLGDFGTTKIARLYSGTNPYKWRLSSPRNHSLLAVAVKPVVNT